MVAIVYQKDTQQLKSQYEGIPANVIHAVVDASNTRKRFIAVKLSPNSLIPWVCTRLSMKKMPITLEILQFWTLLNC